MKVQHQIRIEEAVMFVASYGATLYLNYSWWLFFALLLLPDLSMAGYIFNSRIGAGIYNIFHNRAVAIIVALMGVASGVQYLILAGIVMFGHVAMDRLLGYGLKYDEGFHVTHLGRLPNGRHGQSAHNTPSR